MNQLHVQLLGCLLLLFPAGITEAQELRSDRGIHYSIAYSGNNIWNPGVTLAADRVLRHQGITSVDKSVSTELLWSANTGFYLDPGSHLALYLTAGIGYRKAGQRHAFTLELSPAGLYRSFLTETYLVWADEVSNVFLPGNFYYSPGAGFNIGRKLRGQPANEFFGGLQVITLIPYNTYLMPLVHMRIGLRFASKGGRL